MVKTQYKNYINNVENKSENDSFNALSKLKINDLEVLKDMIEEIEFEIENRKKISKLSTQKFDNIIMEIENMILELPKFNSVSNESSLGSEILKSMTELRKEKINLEELKTQEKISLWRDVANLKREQRILLREFREKETKDEFLDDLIGEL